jgi:hypothetical protein
MTKLINHATRYYRNKILKNRWSKYLQICWKTR